MSTPQRPDRRVPDRRRALALLVASGTGLVGVLLVAVSYLGLGVQTLGAAADPGTAAVASCLSGYPDDPSVEVRYELLPARSLCTQADEGQVVEVVVAAVPTGVLVGGLVLAAGGAVATVLVLTRRRAQ